MDITITVSEKIYELAKQNGKDVTKFVEEVLEEKFPEPVENKLEDEQYENPFTPFVGMFASGRTDTSVRYKEILMNEIDKRGGFGGS